MQYWFSNPKIQRNISKGIFAVDISQNINGYSDTKDFPFVPNTCPQSRKMM